MFDKIIYSDRIYIALAITYRKHYIQEINGRIPHRKCHPTSHSIVKFLNSCFIRNGVPLSLHAFIESRTVSPCGGSQEPEAKTVPQTVSSRFLNFPRLTCPQHVHQEKFAPGSPRTFFLWEPWTHMKNAPTRAALRPNLPRRTCVSSCFAAPLRAATPRYFLFEVFLSSQNFLRVKSTSYSYQLRVIS